MKRLCIPVLAPDRAVIRSLALAGLLCVATGCRQSGTAPESADAGKSPQETMLGMIVAEGLEVTLFAAEPDLRNPTAMDVDAQGRVASHTGPGCIPAAGHRRGDGYSVQANLMLGDEVPDAMARAYEGAEGPFAERLLTALRAAQEAGGDIRGKQSAALLVVRAKPSESWTPTRFRLSMLVGFT